MRLRSIGVVRGSFPDAPEFLRERKDAAARFRAGQSLIGGALALMFALQRVQMPERLSFSRDDTGFVAYDSPLGG